LGVASANNLGGAVSYQSSDPSPRGGLRLEQEAGSFNSLRSFARWDVGTIPLGSRSDGDCLTAYVSLANTSNDKWKGGGQRYSTFPGDRSLFFGQKGLFREAENWQDQLNVKLTAKSGTSRYTVFYDYSD